ncbi:hypothetical protein JL721_12055 [Aureococcus anophagefferens]|nr:hypothetical protein JL721_12055 [Aureococcus anophagefferens]
MAAPTTVAPSSTSAHARLNAACDAAPYGDAAASDVDAASPDYAAPLDDEDTARSEPGASPLDDDDAARYELDAAADAGRRSRWRGRAGRIGGAPPVDAQDYVTLWMVAWSAFRRRRRSRRSIARSTSLAKTGARARRFAAGAARGRWLATGGFAALLDTRGNLLPNLHDALHGPGPLPLAPVATVAPRQGRAGAAAAPSMPVYAAPLGACAARAMP